MLQYDELQQYSNRKFHAHDGWFTNERLIFVNNRVSSQYTLSAQYCLDSFILHGKNRFFHPVLEDFMHNSENNPYSPLISTNPREDLSTHDSYFHVLIANIHFL